MEKNYTHTQIKKPELSGWKKNVTENVLRDKKICTKQLKILIKWSFSEEKPSQEKLENLSRLIFIEKILNTHIE